MLQALLFLSLSSFSSNAQTYSEVERDYMARFPTEQVAQCLTTREVILNPRILSIKPLTSKTEKWHYGSSGATENTYTHILDIHVRGTYLSYVCRGYFAFYKSPVDGRFTVVSNYGTCLSTNSSEQLVYNCAQNFGRLIDPTVKPTN